jgi:hypothetical protein
MERFSMRIRGLAIVLVLITAVCGFAQDRIAGSWQGDKALGDVYISSDGTGAITFLHDPQLTMDIEVAVDGDTYVISQAEPNRDAFYTGVFPMAIARALTEEARPMVWRFQLSPDGEELSGTKYTTYVEFTGGPQPQVRSIDNEYSRPAVWTRLSGRVAQPTIRPRASQAGLPVMVTLDTSTPNARILYTLNGDPPTRESGTVYDDPIRLGDTTTVRVIAVREGWQDSELSEASYVDNSESGDGMSIMTPRYLPVGDRADWYHVNGTNYTSMYYRADVRANTLYELRIWDELDDEARYQDQFRLVDIYLDQDKDDTQVFQSPDHNIYEFFANHNGSVYIEISNRYYEGFGKFGMRLREK